MLDHLVAGVGPPQLVLTQAKVEVLLVQEMQLVHLDFLLGGFVDEQTLAVWVNSLKPPLAFIFTGQHPLLTPKDLSSPLTADLIAHDLTYTYLLR